MVRSRLGIALLVVDAFAAVSSIGGGLALAIGIEADRFPTDWLAGTLFDSYLVPSLLLVVAVGGSAAIAAFAVLLRSRYAGRWSIAAGLVMVGWIVGEIVILTGDHELVSVAELAYLVVGLMMIGLGWSTERTWDPTGEA
jgi:hypothetical protein